MTTRPVGINLFQWQTLLPSRERYSASLDTSATDFLLYIVHVCCRVDIYQWLRVLFSQEIFQVNRITKMRKLSSDRRYGTYLSC